MANGLPRTGGAGPEPARYRAGVTTPPDPFDPPGPADLLSTEDTQVLDHVAWAALTGPHARFAEGVGLAARYHPEVSPFAAVPTRSGRVEPAAWADLARLTGPGLPVLLSGLPEMLDTLPAGWQVETRLPGVQMVATAALPGEPDPEAIRLGADDVEDMLDLVARTQPGPFLPRTVELGTYLGVRRHGKLVAMAGERVHPPGWTEISAVCTDPAARGQGLAGRLVRAVAHGIRARGEVPFLHAAAENTGAVRLYEALGFTVRRRPTFFVLCTPGPRAPVA